MEINKHGAYVSSSVPPDCLVIDFPHSASLEELKSCLAHATFAYAIIVSRSEVDTPTLELVDVPRVCLDVLPSLVKQCMEALCKASQYVFHPQCCPDEDTLAAPWVLYPRDALPMPVLRGRHLKLLERWGNIQPWATVSKDGSVTTRLAWDEVLHLRLGLQPADVRWQWMRYVLDRVVSAWTWGDGPVQSASRMACLLRHSSVPQEVLSHYTSFAGVGKAISTSHAMKGCYTVPRPATRGETAVLQQVLRRRKRPRGMKVQLRLPCKKAGDGNVTPFVGMCFPEQYCLVVDDDEAPGLQRACKCCRESEVATRDVGRVLWELTKMLL